MKKVMFLAILSVGILSSCNENRLYRKINRRFTGNARHELELKTGKSAVSSLNTKSGIMPGKGGNVELGE